MAKSPRALVFGMMGDLSRQQRALLPSIALPLPPVPCDDVPCAPNWLGRNIYVRRLPPVWGSEMPSEIHVYNLFSRCGPVERLRVLRDRLTHQPLGSALVLFVDARSAASAIQFIHSGAVPGAIADFWLPRTLLRGPESGQSAAPSDGWTPAPSRDATTPAE